MYIQIVYLLPIIADPTVLAEFVEAPEIGLDIAAFIAMVDPIANPPNSPLLLYQWPRRNHKHQQFESEGLPKAVSPLQKVCQGMSSCHLQRAKDVNVDA